MHDGQRIGRFLVLGPVGAGGIGTVYAAYDTSLDRKIALKFLPGAPGDRRAMDRLLAEAGAMAKLSHPNVVTVYDVGEHEGQPYLAMELVEGETLASWRRARPRTLRELLHVFTAAARGLAAAHAAGIAHGDVEPTNILVAGARVLVTDFGISVRALAPEQRRGDPVDARTDVYGFCATMKEMLQVDLPPRPPAWLQRVVTRGMDPDPARRYPDMNAVVRALQANPRARALRILPAVGAALAFVAAFWVGAYRTADPLRRCQAGAQTIDGVWNAARRRQLEGQFARAGQADAWRLTERHLDHYAGEWRQRYRQNCSAQFDRRTQSGEVFDLRVACLDGRQVAFSTFVQLLPALPTAKLSTAATASAGLPLLADCDSSSWTAKKPLPTDPQARKQIAAAQALVEETVAQLLVGNYTRAWERISAALTAARPLAYEPLLAHALAQAAVVERRRGGVTKEAGKEVTEADRAARLLEEAFVVAERGRDDLRRASAAREMVMTELSRGRYDEARVWGQRASSILARIGDPPEARASLEMNLGWLALQLDRKKEAAASFARALELRKRVLPPDDPEQLGPRIGACEVAPVGEPQLRCYRALVPFTRRALGPGHPDTAAVLNNLAGLLMEDRRTLAEACRLFQEAFQIRYKLEPSNQEAIDFEGNLANCEHELGQVAEARRHYEDALSRAVGPSLVTSRAHLQADYGIFLAHTGQPTAGVKLLRESLAQRIGLFGEKHDKVVYTRSVLADLLALDGHPDQALQQLNLAIRAAGDRAEPTTRLAALHDQHGLLLQDAWKRYGEARQSHVKALAIHDGLKSTDEDRHTSWHGLGAAQLGLGLIREAIANLEKALAVRAAGKVRPEEHADTAVLLARALIRAGRPASQPRARACELAQQSLGPYRDAGIIRQRQRGELERWLQQQRCPARNPRS